MGAFAVGDHVVYPPHGAGTVVDVQERDDAVHISIQIIRSKMTLSVPLERAVERGVRPVISTKRANEVLKALAGAGSEMLEKPQERARQTAAQIRSGDVDELSAVLRDLVARKETGKTRSPAEQKAFDNAHQGLVSEIALAKNISEAEAAELIDGALGIVDGA